MKKDDLISQLCAPYCVFYKPGKDDDLSCNGFLIFHRLIETGLKVPFLAPNTEMQPATEDSLFRAICPPCPYFGADCDFAAWKKSGGTEVKRSAPNPCGGFLCLAYCIDRGRVDIQDINRVI